jgi:hypothetical protein
MGYFMEWPGGLPNRLARLSDLSWPDAPDADRWSWGCWPRLTGMGERVLAALPALDDWVFDDGGL